MKGSDRIIKRLIQKAEEAREKAIARYSNFRVGAALLSKDGKIYTGCNIENPSLTLGVCAERVALYKALSEGAKSFDAIAVVSNEETYCSPCGSCRQLLWEFSPGLKVILMDREAGPMVKNIGELLPAVFDYRGLAKRRKKVT